MNIKYRITLTSVLFENTKYSMPCSFGPKGKFSKCTKFPMIFHANKSLRKRNYKKVLIKKQSIG